MPETKRNFTRVVLTTLKVILLLAACLVVGAIWHEAVGHGLTAVALGGRIEAVEILGMQLYPRPHWQGWSQRYGSCEFAGVDGDRARQVVSLAGSMSTWSIAFVAMILLWLRRWGRRSKFMLTGLAVWWIDLFTYTLPSWGLPRSVLWGQSRYSEPYEAAVALGLPGPVFQGFVIVSSLILAAALLLRVLQTRTRHLVASAAPSELAGSPKGERLHS